MQTFLDAQGLTPQIFTFTWLLVGSFRLMWRALPGWKWKGNLPFPGSPGPTTRAGHLSKNCSLCTGQIWYLGSRMDKGSIPSLTHKQKGLRHYQPGAGNVAATPPPESSFSRCAPPPGTLPCTQVPTGGGGQQWNMGLTLAVTI